MQKKILAVAVASALAMPAVALAQVTVYGSIDTGIRNQSKVIAFPADDSVLKVTNGLRTTNRWGLKGSDDMGGGLMANFTLEGTYTSDDNSDTLDGFHRKSIVGLSSGGNSVDIGRDYTVNFKSQGIYDPMSYTYTGVTPTAGATFTAGTRSNNMVTAGFRFGAGGVRVDYAAGEQVGDNSLGTRTGIGGDFAFGPVTVAGAFSTTGTTTTADTTTTNIGAAYGMGGFTFRGGLSTAEVDSGDEHQLMMLGVQYALSPTLNGRFGYYNWTVDNAGGVEIATRKTLIVALDYVLSKRTTAYVAFDNSKLTGAVTGFSATSTAGIGSGIDGSASNDGTTGLSVGVAHSF